MPWHNSSARGGPSKLPLPSTLAARSPACTTASGAWYSRTASCGSFANRAVALGHFELLTQAASAFRSSRSARASGWDACIQSSHASCDSISAVEQVWNSSERRSSSASGKCRLNAPRRSCRKFFASTSS